MKAKQRRCQATIVQNISIPSFVQYPYLFFPSSDPTQYYGLKNDLQKVLSFEKSYEHRRRMLAPYQYQQPHILVINPVTC